MKHSIFWKLVLIILPLALLVDLGMLAAAYKVNYDSNLEHCREDLENVTEMIADTYKLFDPYDLEDHKYMDSYFEKMCETYDLKYLYAERPDIENDTFTYLAIGFGEGASENAKSERYSGYTGSGVDKAKVKAIEESKPAFRYQDNRYGKVLICYMPVKEYYDSNDKLVNKTVSLIGAEMSVDDIYSEFITKFARAAALVFLTTLLIILVIGFFFRRKVSKPARLISKRMADFMSDRENNIEPIVIKGNDEFAEMAGSFNSMAREIDRYVKDISELNHEKAKQAAELKIARNIQLGLLEPNEFCNMDADIFAYMLPAKNVGGDLYDYQVLKNGKVCVVIADVSGKGVSASLFMSRAITLLHQYAEAELSPGEILFRYNNHLAERNPNTMFITTFVGIYDPKTNELVYSDAGHNKLYVLSDELIELNNSYAMAAGIVSGETYPESTIRLKTGDTLFMYTDGVTEAKNTEDELFGDDALKQTLSDNLGKSGKDVLNAVLQSVNDFSNGAAQSDDITILTMTVPRKDAIRLHITAKKENLADVNKAIDSLDISDDGKYSLKLIAEEMFINICSYAYGRRGGEIDITIKSEGQAVTLTFEDSGKPFDPTKDVTDLQDYDADTRIGGLGRFLTFETADSYSYERSDGKNILRITKNIDK